MLTPRGVGLATGSVLLWATGRLLGVGELYVVAAAAACLVIGGVLAVRMSSATVSVRRGLSTTRLRNGATAEASIDLRNDGRVTSPLLLVEDSCHWSLADRPAFAVESLRPSTTAALRYELHGTTRGRYRIGPVRVRVRDPFGTVQQTRRYSATDELVVLPVVEWLPDGLARGTHRGSSASDSRRLFTTGDEFHTMREYVQGDDLRLVHWPSTARRGELMVRQQEQPWQAEATVFLDTRARAYSGVGPDSTFEKAVSAAASVVWHLADHGYRLRFVTGADGRSPQVEGWDAILDRLAEVEASRGDPLGQAALGLGRAGAEGLLLAVLAPPPGDQPVAADPGVRALVHAARGHRSRAAVVIAPSRGPGRAADLVLLLRVAGWKATLVEPGDLLADRWGDLTGSRSPASAYQPDPA